MNNILTLYTCCDANTDTSTYVNTCKWYESVEDAVASIGKLLNVEECVVNLGITTIPKNSQALVKLVSTGARAGYVYTIETCTTYHFDTYCINRVDMEKTVDWAAVKRNVFDNCVGMLLNKYDIGTHNMSLFTNPNDSPFDSYRTIAAMGRDSMLHRVAYTVLLDELRDMLSERYPTGIICVNSVELVEVCTNETSSRIGH